MLKRLFWLGLLLASITAFWSLRRKPRPAVPLPLLLDLTGDALVACGSDGAVIYTNAAARTLFGPEAAHSPLLRYSSGQRVPPGQMPLSRVQSTGQSFTGAEYHCASGGAACVLDASAYLLPGGGAAAVFRDVTARHEYQARLSDTQAQQAALRTLGRRLGAAQTLEAVSRAVVEEAHSALDLRDVQVRLYGYHPAAQTLTRLASEPEDRPKRPRLSAQSQPPVFAFDAGVPALWQLYIGRQPAVAGLSVLGEAEAASAYAQPLLAGGAAVGHLFISSSTADAFDDPATRDVLELIASAAALALAGPQAAQLAAHAVHQRDAVREIAQAIAGGSLPDGLADLAAGHIKRLTGAEVCTVSAASDKNLRILGTALQDALLFPERGAPESSALQNKAVQKAWRTQKTVISSGLANPSYEKAVWRAFAVTGCHSVTALPLASRGGVLAVYTNGALPLPDLQVRFLETIAALLSVGLKSATAEAARADG